LQIAFQPQTRTIDVEVTLVADEQPDRDGETSQGWSVPPAGIEPATHGLGNVVLDAPMRRLRRFSAYGAPAHHPCELIYP